MAVVNCVGTTSDGYILGNSANFDTARQTSQSYNVSGMNLYVGMDYDTGLYFVYRGFLKFDTTPVPSAASVVKVNMILTALQDESATDFDVQICKCDWSSYDPITSLNQEQAYDAARIYTNVDQTWRNTSGISLNTPYTSPDLDTSWVNKGGYTYYTLMSNYDISATPPSGSQDIILATQEVTTEAYRPLLVVEYGMRNTGQAFFFG